VSLGVVHLDPSGAPDNNSLWLYRTIDAGESWSAAVRLVRGLGQPVHHPQFSLLDGRVTVVSLTITRGVSEARSFDLGVRDPISLVAFGEAVAQVFPKSRAGTAEVWTTYHQQSSSESSARLRLWASTHSGSPQSIAVVKVPFDGSIGVVASDPLIMAAGPVRGASPSEPALSLMLYRLAVRCE
jgi:hypothetical protein